MMNKYVLYGALAVLAIGLIASWVVILGLQADVAELQDSQGTLSEAVAAMEESVSALARSVEDLAEELYALLEEWAWGLFDSLGLLDSLFGK